jgi:hypothetical protein
MNTSADIKLKAGVQEVTLCFESGDYFNVMHLAVITFKKTVTIIRTITVMRASVTITGVHCEHRHSSLEHIYLLIRICVYMYAISLLVHCNNSSV